MTCFTATGPGQLTNVASSLDLGQNWVLQQDNDFKQINILIAKENENKGVGIASSKARPQSLRDAG